METLKLADYISIFGHIGTWLGLVLVFFTLLEMFRQRKQSYKPDLFISQRMDFDAYSTPIYGIPLKWEKAGTVPTSEGFTEVNLEVVNVGLGPAKRVSIEWDFDWKKFIDEIEASAIGGGEGVSFKKEGTDSVYSILFNNQPYVLFNFKNDLNRNIDYLLPAQSEGKHHLCVPPSIIYLFSILYFAHIKEAKLSLLPLEIPIKIVCSDLGGSKQKKNLKLTIDLVMVSKDGLLEAGKKMFTFSFIINEN